MADAASNDAGGNENFPYRIVDPHHHFFEPSKNKFQAFLGGLGCPDYTAENYAEHVKGLPIVKTVHVEAIPGETKEATPDEELAEAQWVQKLKDEKRCKVARIVAACHLYKENAEEALEKLKQVPMVGGIRLIIDHCGEPFDAGKNATHVATSRFDIDCMRDPEYAPKFEKGLKAVSDLGWTYDLQVAPCQLPAAAEIFGRLPDLKVVIDHLGKPRHLQNTEEDKPKLDEWRKGMKLMSQLPNAYVKLSMLGYSVPSWSVDEKKEELLKSLVLEVIEMFGADRCMFASNWHVNGPVSNADGACDTGPEPMELYKRFLSWVKEMPEADQKMLFAGTAEKFYSI